MTDDNISTTDTRFCCGIVICCIVSTIMLFIVAPWLMGEVQSESEMCGKEFHGMITPIASLKTDKNIGGSFFLGTGTIRTERVYIAYTGNNQVGYSLIERPISQSLLFEDTNESPYIEDTQVMICESYGFARIDRYKIHVPVGTIKMEYSI